MKKEKYCSTLPAVFSNRQIGRRIDTREIMEVAEHNGKFYNNIPKHGRKRKQISGSKEYPLQSALPYRSAGCHLCESPDYLHTPLFIILHFCFSSAENRKPPISIFVPTRVSTIILTRGDMTRNIHIKMT